jgi:hypothetical protein
VPIGVNWLAAIGAPSKVTAPIELSGAISVRKCCTNCDPPTVEKVYDRKYWSGGIMLAMDGSPSAAPGLCEPVMN